MARAIVRLDGLVVLALAAALLNIGCSEDDTSSAAAASTSSSSASGGVRRAMELTDEQWTLVVELGGEADELGKECQASPPEEAEAFAARYKALVERVDRAAESQP